MQTGQKQSVTMLVLRILFTLFLFGTIIFIFSNSSDIGAVSAGKSQAATAWLNGLMQRLAIGFTFTESLVRKLAHFAEYALLGFWLMLTLRVYTKRILAFISWPVLGGLLTAVLDEFYQTTVPGRSGQVTDIVVDFAGVVLGLCVALFLQLLFGAIFQAFSRRSSHRRITHAI